MPNIKASPCSIFIGVDLGTSGCRAVAIDESAKIQAEASTLYTDSENQTPQMWWRAVQIVFNKLLQHINADLVKSIAVDGTSGTVLLCDTAGEPLTPALMYYDARATQQAEFLQLSAPQDSVVLAATSGLAKVLWLLDNTPALPDFHIVHQADWIAGQLCQRFDFSDVNNALKTGFDARNHHWPVWLKQILLQRKIDKKCLPHVYLPGETITNIDADIALSLGLPIATMIVAGTTDSTAAFIASTDVDVQQTEAELKPGQAVTSLGSTLVLKIISDIAINSPQHGIYSQPHGKYWLVGGGSNSGGAVLRHYFTDEQMRRLTKEVKPETDTHLNYYPLLKKGERFPINDPGLAPRLTPKAENDATFFQALLEGIAEIEHTGYKLLQQLGAPYPTSVITNGGGAINTAWNKIRENKLGVPVSKALHSDAAYGAAKLAAKITFNT